jgi:methyl-accepting chemotaxis protein
MFRNRKLGTKIGLGFGLVGAILAVTALLTIWQVSGTATTTTRVIELRAPTLQNSQILLNGMNHSLAALRGWIILGKDKFKVGRAKAWSEEIDPAVAFMDRISKNWTDPENIDRLKRIKSKLNDFRKYQKQIEDISHTPENNPALKLLFTEAAPRAAKLVKNITSLIDQEAEEPATARRKALLGMMADIRGTTGLALANIRAFLLSGEGKFQSKFEKFWAKNERRFNDLKENASLLTERQRLAFVEFSQYRSEFAPLPRKMFKIRNSKEWNQANLWLGTRAAPTAAAIVKDVNAMLGSQKALMANDSAAAAASVTTLKTLVWALLFVGVFLSGILGVFITRSITRPVAELADAAIGIAEGDVAQDIAYESADELGQLADAFREMVVYVGDAANAAHAIGEGDLANAQVAPRSKRDKLAHSMNEAVASLTGLMSETDTLITAARNGDLSVRGDAGKYKGGYAELVEGINCMLDATTAPVREAAAAMQRVAQRDLSARVDGNFQGDHAALQNDINSATEILDGAMGQVTSAVSQLKTASDQVASGSQSLANTTTEQAATLEEISATLRLVSSQSEDTATGATKAKELSGSAEKTAIEGNQAVQQLAQALDQIKSSANETVKIVRTIDQIAFQTNVLALNAAVEAARAGESGRGFAVVADQVGRLAQRVADASRDTSERIEESAKHAELGVSLGQNVEGIIAELANSAGQVNDIVVTIAESAQSQAHSVGEVNNAMSEANVAVQQNAAGAEESAAAAQELEAQACELQRLASEFRLSNDRRAPTLQHGLSPYQYTPAAVQMAQPVSMLPTASVASLGNGTPPVEGNIGEVVGLTASELADF